ncbi:MAG: hypothetical protein GWN01_17345, partial [Nitrosopumilaceae archaeon]|nr:hypothetical protein [Nitrosopumilaceae archaeon]NIU89057.1 hypothetical protein [Nitrosopumilaceae archaeon]NIV67154.1 hypothetical protein [Nitrosopumilaceae archaeon]NIX63193.1 hypothetical protein [Nitrosopumilaceae archaeon]
ELINEIGINAYNEMVRDQKAKIKSYMEHHANEIDSHIVEEGVEDVEQLSSKGKYLLSKWE